MQKINLSNYNTLLFFLLRASFVGGVSANLLITSKRDSLLSTIIASILGIIPLIIFYFLIKSYPRKNIIEIINEVFGKTFGTLINLILSLFIIFNASLIFRNLINFISSQFLYQTPDLIIGLVFIVAIIYSLYHGITTISRSSTILFYLFSILFLISLIGLFNQANLTNFLPMLEYGINPVLKGTYNYISLNILPIYILTIIPYNEIENHSKFLKNTIIFYILSSISIMVVCFSIISVYGINFANLIEYPEFHLLKRIDIFGFLQRIENILAIQWIFDIYFYTLVSSYYIYKFIDISFKKGLKVKDEIKKRIISFFIPIIILILSLLIFNNNTVDNYFINNYLPTLNIIFFLIIPTLILIIIKLKKVILKV